MSKGDILSPELERVMWSKGRVRREIRRVTESGSRSAGPVECASEAGGLNYPRLTSSQSRFDIDPQTSAVRPRSLTFFDENSRN